MSLKVSQISFSKQSVGRHQNDRISSKGHFAGVRISNAYEEQSTGTTRMTSSVLSKQEKSVNKSINTTAVDNYSGRLSFGAGLHISDATLEKIAKNGVVQQFIKIAGEKVLVAEAAVALLVNCSLRPATIMATPSSKNDHKKKKKAAAKSIASGIAGFGVAQFLTSPLNKSVDKIVRNPERFLWGKEKVLAKDLVHATKTVLSQGIAMGFSPLRAALTVALLPIMERTIITPIFGDKQQDTKQDYMMNHLYLKGSKMATDEFKDFREGRV